MKQAFQCDFCNKTFDKDSECLEHESKCDFNPDNKRCSSCKYSVKTNCLANVDSPRKYQTGTKVCDDWTKKNK